MVTCRTVPLPMERKVLSNCCWCCDNGRCEEMVHKVHACCSPKRIPRNLMTGVYEWMIDFFIDLATHPAQWESKEQGCNTTLERGAGVEFWPKSRSPRMASPCADQAGSMPKNGYGSCMAMIQPVLCHLNLLEPSRLDVCAALSKRRCFF